MFNFENNPNITKVYEDIWVYENFLNQEECVNLKNLADSLTEPQWNEANSPLDWYNGKVSIALPELLKVNDKVNIVVAPNYIATPNSSFHRMFAGDSMHEHEDTCGENEATSNDVFGTCAITKYGAVAYFADSFEGGELYYPGLGLKIKPRAGDLLIHGALIRHGVAEVTSGVRYAYSTFLVEKK
jgi:hypothetical protein